MPAAQGFLPDCLQVDSIPIVKMDGILANVALLDTVLLETDEEEYDSVANQALQALRKISTNDSSKVLEVMGTITLRPQPSDNLC